MDGIQSPKIGDILPKNGGQSRYKIFFSCGKKRVCGSGPVIIFQKPKKFEDMIGIGVGKNGDQVFGP